MLEILTVVTIALVWTFLAESLSLYNLTVGALLGLLLLSIVQREQEGAFTRRLGAFFRFLGQFLYELVVANIMVALLAIKPRPELHPHIIAVPLTIESGTAIALLSATITLLPGTVAMGVSADERTLYAHAIGEADVERSRESVLRIERLILGFMK